MVSSPEVWPTEEMILWIVDQKIGNKDQDPGRALQKPIDAYALFLSPPWDVISDFSHIWAQFSFSLIF